MEFPSDIGVYAKNTMAAIQASLEHLKWKQLPKDFFKALSLCVPTMATDPNFGSLTLLDIEPDGKMITCDDYQISIYQLSTPMDPFALTRSVVLKIKPLSKFSEYALDEEKRWLHFRQSNGTVFSVITSVVKFSTQKILSLLEGEVSGPYRFPEGTVKALRRAGIFGETSSEDEYRYVGICAEGDVLHITGTHPHGSVDEVVPMNGAVLPNLRIKIRPEHLEKILGLTSTFTVVGTSMFVFEQENYKYTIGFRTSEDN
jgi:hypothetical protein